MTEDDQSEDEIASFEAKWAAGFIKENGKHVAVDGLVGRDGQRRILPDNSDDEWLADYRVERLAELTPRVLHGRNATVFEARVLDPLMGRPKRSVHDLAKQFGVSADKIHKITERAKLKIQRALAPGAVFTTSQNRQATKIRVDYEYSREAGTWIETRRIRQNNGEYTLLDENWAGDPRLHPRQSFAEWRQQNTATSTEK